MRALAAWLLLAANPAPAAELVGKFEIATVPAGIEEACLVSKDGYHFVCFDTLGEQETWYWDGRRRVYPKGTVTMRHDGHQGFAAALSEDGSVLATVETVRDEQGKRLGQAVYRNGKAASGVYLEIGTPMLSRDGSTLAFSASRRSGEPRVVWKGGEGPCRFGIWTQSPISPSGDRISYLCNRTLVVDNKIVPGDYVDLFMNEDWTRRADLRWLADGKLELTAGAASLKTTARVFGFQFDRAGSGFAYLQRFEPHIQVSINGVRTGRPLNQIQGEIVFSPTGAAYWYADGALHRNGTAQSSWRYIWGNPPIAFSPKGAHSAFVAQPETGTSAFVIVDGKKAFEVPFPFQKGAVRFDNEDEFHFLTLDQSADPPVVALICGSVAGGLSPARSSCARKARALQAAGAK